MLQILLRAVASVPRERIFTVSWRTLATSEITAGGANNTHEIYDTLGRQLFVGAVRRPGKAPPGAAYGRGGATPVARCAGLDKIDCMTASAAPTGPPPSFASFREFYPYYLGEHGNRTSRRLHVSGTPLALAIAAGAVVTSRWAWLLAVPLAGYLPAWVGHFFFEGNSPATFRYPLYSLRGDFSMLAEVLTGRMRW